MRLFYRLLGRFTNNYKEKYPNPDRFFRRQQWLRFAWRYWGRNRVCYSLAVRRVNKGLMYSTISRQVTKERQRELWEERLDAATREHGFNYELFVEGLARSNINLDHKVLSELAIYEPYSFKSLVDISKAKCSQHELGVGEFIPTTTPLHNAEKL